MRSKPVLLNSFISGEDASIYLSPNGKKGAFPNLGCVEINNASNTFYMHFIIIALCGRFWIMKKKKKK